MNKRVTNGGACKRQIAAETFKIISASDLDATCPL
jgi:hypothetical protein